MLNPAPLDQALAAAIAAGIPGIAVAVTTPIETIYQSCAGTLAPGGAPVTPDTLFWIASMTKPITSLAAMQLVEQGRLSLDAPLATLLPELAGKQIIEAGALRPAQTQITLRHLLTHTAGFGYALSNPALAAWAEVSDLVGGGFQRAGLAAPLLFEPGTRWEYGISTDWVGQAVEAASGESLDEYFHNHITGPLGMADTLFVPGPAYLPRRIAIQQRGPAASRFLPPEPVAVPAFFAGGSGLYSTLHDYQKLTRAFLNGGAGLVSPATFLEMHTNQIGELPVGLDPSGADGGDQPPPVLGWGFGFAIGPAKSASGRSASAFWWAGMASTFFWVDPEKNIAGTVLMQIIPPGEVSVLRAYASVERAVYAALQ